VILSMQLGCSGDERDYAQRCESSRWLAAADRDGVQGKVVATASCWFGECPAVEVWAPGAEAEMAFQTKESLEGVLSVQSSDPTVLSLDALPAREVVPAHSCVPPLDVRITALAPGDADIVVLRDGEPYDRLSLPVLQPIALELEASGTMHASDRFCAQQGSTAAFVPHLFGEHGAAIGHATPGWEWEVDGWPSGNHSFDFITVPAGEVRVTVRWRELSRTLIMAPCP
jgi:hypothetical protein